MGRPLFPPLPGANCVTRINSSKGGVCNMFQSLIVALVSINLMDVKPPATW